MAFNDNSKNLKFTKSSIVNPKSFIRISKVWCQMRHFCGLFVLFFFNKVILCISVENLTEVISYAVEVDIIEQKTTTIIGKIYKIFYEIIPTFTKFY